MKKQGVLKRLKQAALSAVRRYIGEGSEREFLLGGSSVNHSGMVVNYETALTYDLVWRAVNLLSTGVAKLPLDVYQTTEEGRIKLRKHVGRRLMMYKANDEIKSYDLRMAIQGNAMLQGNGYAFIARDYSGRPVSLTWLDPRNTWPFRENGVLRYTTVINDAYKLLRPRDVLHIKGLGYDGLVGYPVISKATDSIGHGMAANRWSTIFFKNGATPPTVVTVPTMMPTPAQEEFRKQWNEMHQGVDNAHKIAILSNGAVPKQLGLNAKESQLIESRAFSRVEMANWFGLPPHKLGDSSRVSYNSLEQENQSYLDDSLDPWLVEWETECNTKLLSEKEYLEEGFYFEYNRQAIVRADMKSQYEAFAIGIQSGFLAPNEPREKLNLPKKPGGDQLRKPLNMQDVTDDSNMSGGDEQKDRAAAELFDAIEQRFKTLIEHKRERRPPDVFGSELHEKIMPQLAEALRPACVLVGLTPEDARQRAEEIVNEYFSVGATAP